ncbi:MAG: VOC family protein [Rhodospirillales bacterium]
MDPRISLITLGVADMKAARAFYEKLGWRASEQSNDDVTFFQAGGMILGLYGRAALAEDAKVEDGKPGFSGVALAYNGRDKAEVDRVLNEAVAAGGTLVKKAEDVFWGGYSGYFADPDGHLWEVAFNPFFPIAEDGSISLGDA